MNDTIVALATPNGRSGIGVIRLSGKDSLSIIKTLIRDEKFDPQPRLAVLKKIYDIQTNEVLDEVIILYFQSPQSFTGEDVIEISGHGSPVVLRQIIDQCLKLDARMAEAGEFSLRALTNGRLNLTQAEAIRDLIDAQTIASARQSVRQLRGEISFQLQPIKDELLDVIVILESSLEFVEDDLPGFQIEKLINRLSQIIFDISKMASTFKAGKLLREGLKVALVGRPNVGKSSIFNALLGHERAIVTEIAGTTRDHISEKLVINNIPVSIIDTAGLRETSDKIERIGVERSKRIMSDADLVLVILDGSQKLTDEDAEIIAQSIDFPHLIVINKFDVYDSLDFNSLTYNFISTSAITGHGIAELQKAIVNPFLIFEPNQSGFLISDARHFDLLLRSINDIEKSIGCLKQNLSEEIVLIGLHNALLFLGQITGETSTEDMLSKIFSTFCIGK